MDDVRFALLGPLRAWRGREEIALGAKQQRLILALLLARAGGWVSVVDLVGLLWEEGPPPSAVNVVHRYIGTLRRLLEPQLPLRAQGRWLIGRTGSYRMNVDATSLDLLAFREGVEHGRRAVTSGRTEEAVTLLASALSRWQDRCAADLDRVADHPDFVALENECVDVVCEAARLAAEYGRAAAVLPVLRRTVVRNPLHEVLSALLMRLLAADGKSAEAIGLYQQVSQALKEQLGVLAGPELQDALKELLANSVDADSRPGEIVPADPPVERGPQNQLGISPAQLPSVHPYFTGRHEVLDELIDYSTRHSGPLVVGIDGIPGVGKTTLAVRFAHLMAARYPDGQLYADLRGFDARRQPAEPGDVLSNLLSALGAVEPPGDLGLESRAAFYRSVLAERRLLILLDNASDAEQVEPLLPGTANCIVIVTSRTRLLPLALRTGAHLITLDVPSAAEARDGFTNRIGNERARKEKAALDEVIEHCGRLPLAMAVVAARAAEEPLPLILSELKSAQQSLDAFSDENLDNDLRTIFSWSYRRLTPAAARLFRLLSLHPGPDITADSAAAMTGVSDAEARRQLAELMNTRLITRHRPGRHRMHMLFRTYAAELAAETDPETAQHDAVRRLYEFYQAGADAANRLIEGSGQVRAGSRNGTDSSSAEIPDGTPAMTWFIEEHDVLRGLVDDATRRGEVSRVWKLVVAMQLFYHRYCWWSEWREVAERALEATIADGDRKGQAHMERCLAGALFFLGHRDEALAHLRSAVDIFEWVGLDSERAHVLMNLSRVLLSKGSHGEALRHHREAILLLRRHGHRSAEASALQVMANYLVAARPTVAEALAYRAADLCAAIGDVQGLAICDELLARCALTRGRLLDARRYSDRGIERLSGTHYRVTQGESFTTSGDILAASGEWDAAQQAWEKALEHFDDIRTQYTLALIKRLGRHDDPV